MLTKSYIDNKDRNLPFEDALLTVLHDIHTSLESINDRISELNESYDIANGLCPHID